ncbi:hypothetical protein CH373_17245 [Leptospira perolatii]|uniref:VTT domain-containing protein n=1 Tax=Leptospira perolatii TaxID=2023191 RepID=A0A2M9ZIK6_9LEPT|nr:DedA family protein [Leptospira perolatii]PJZ68559.1 hypothetical protein CH360_15705 [Leptospira perolatii]PJZ71889.1 hypothetical protein CH373_17245 [Leptospira perolatii]
MDGFESYLQNLLDSVAALPPLLLWFFFAFSNFAENVFPPWPGDTVTVFGGFLVARENSGFGILALVTSTFFGNLAGAWVMYSFGNRFLHWLKHKDFPFKSELYDEEAIHKTLNWFSRNSVLVVIFSRFSAGIRFFVSIVAGMVHMRPIAFFSYFSLAVLLWCGLLIYAGFYLGSNWEKVLEFLNLYNKIITFLLIAAGLIFVAYRWKTYRVSEKNKQKEN